MVTLFICLNGYSQPVRTNDNRPVSLTNLANNISGTFSGNGTNVYLDSDQIPTRYDVSSGIFSGWNYKYTILSNYSTNYDTFKIRCATILKRNGQIYLFYSVNNTADVNNIGRIGWASGVDISHLTLGGIALTPTVGQWDSNHVQGPRIFTDNGTNYMYYFGGTATFFEGRPNSIGVAYQADTTNWSPSGWTKYGQLLAPSANFYDSNGLWRPFVIKNANSYYLFYNATPADNSSEQISVAISTNGPLGPFVRYSGNPVMSWFPLGEQSDMDPFIFRTTDNGFYMGFVPCCSTIAFTYSRDLLKWSTPTRVPINNAPTFNYGFPIQSFEMFYDDGPSAVWDDTSNIYYGKPGIFSLNASNIQTSALSPAGLVVSTNIFSKSIGVGSWNLTNYYSPALWLKADAITGLQSGWSLTNWNDSSVNANNTSLTSTKTLPIYEIDPITRLPYVQFNGTSSSLSTANVTLGTNLTIICAVSRPWSQSPYAPILTASYDSGGASGIGLFASSGGAQDWTATNVLFFGHGYTAGNAPRSLGYEGVFPDNNVAIISATLSPSLARIWFNGTVISTLESPASIPTITGPIQIGSTTTANNYFDGRMYEIILFSGTLADNDRQKLEAYLATKWNNTYLPNTNIYSHFFGFYPIQSVDVSGIITNSIATTTIIPSVTIVSTGVTNNMGVNAIAHIEGSSVSYVVHNNIGTALWTNITVSTTSSTTEILQPGGSITAASGLSGIIQPF